MDLLVVDFKETHFDFIADLKRCQNGMNENEVKNT